MKPIRFRFDDSPTFDGFSHGSTWNGFDNVAVTPAVLSIIVAYFRAIAPDFPETEQGNQDMLAIPPTAAGLISLGWGYATQIVDEPPATYVLDGEPIEDFADWLYDNDFEPAELLLILTLQAGESMELGGGAAARFVLGRET